MSKTFYLLIIQDTHIEDELSLYSDPKAAVNQAIAEVNDLERVKDQVFDIEIYERDEEGWWYLATLTNGYSVSVREVELVDD